jgi:hypothetical protein
MQRGRANPLALAGVFIGAAGFAASLTAVYRAMRDLMVNSGGFCASGGPYEIAAGHQCGTGQTVLLIGGIFAMLLFGAVLLGSTGWWGGGSIMGVGLLMWAALFGALGLNFIQLGFNPPRNMSGAGGWIVCGIVFWLMALGGLIPGLMALAKSFKNEADPAATTFTPPLVRANVNFQRSMPGDPAFGMTDPNAAANAGKPAPPDQAPPTRASTAGDFVDPVTGEHLKGGADA